MEKMNKAYVGTVEKWSTAHLTNTPGEITSMTFKDGTLRDNPWPFEPHEKCYLVKKKDLDAYEARIKQLKRTLVWGENQLLTTKVKALEAENAYLTRINEDFFKERSKLVEENEALVERNTKLKCKVDKFYGMTSVEEELRAANEKLAAEVDDLKEKIKELGVIKSFLEVGNEKLIVYNTELKSRNKNLELENAKLRGELSRANDELAKFYGEHTVEFLYEKHEDGKHFIGWTEVSGEDYELTFLTPERKIHE